MMSERTPTLIIIGGFAGSGKTTITRRLSMNLGLPRLEADILGKTIKRLDVFGGDSDEAYRIGYATLWRLCEEFLSCRVSVIVDANMAWDVAWDAVEAVCGRNPGTRMVPIILQCPREVCLERVRRRYVYEPGWHGDPERFKDDHATMLWEYIQNLNRPELRLLDSNRPLEDVYADVLEHLTASTRLC